VKIPEKLKVGGKNYKVIYPHNFNERPDLSAQCDNGTNIIRVQNRTMGGEILARENIEESFLHEIIHAVDLIYNGGRLKEETVKQLAQGLYQVLSDNGMLEKK
jgi:hypothetical protein